MRHPVWTDRHIFMIIVWEGKFTGANSPFTVFEYVKYVCPLLGACFLVFAILANSFSKLLEQAFPPLIYRVVSLQELDPNSTGQLQANIQCINHDLATCAAGSHCA